MQCQNCRWWSIHPNLPPSKVGICKRYPPQWVTVEACAFPITEPENLCGEWREKASEDSAAS